MKHIENRITEAVEENREIEFMQQLRQYYLPGKSTMTEYDFVLDNYNYQIKDPLISKTQAKYKALLDYQNMLEYATKQNNI